MIRNVPMLCVFLFGCSESRSPKTVSEPPAEVIVPVAQPRAIRSGGLLDPSWQGNQCESGKTSLDLSFQPGTYWIKFRTVQESSEGPIFDAPISMNYRIEFSTRAGETLRFFEGTLEDLPDTGGWLWLAKDMPELAPGYLEAVLSATVFVGGVPEEKTLSTRFLKFQSDGTFTVVSHREFENAHDYGACGWDSGQGMAYCGGMGESPAGEPSTKCPLEVTPGTPCDGQFHTCCAPGGALWVCESWGGYALAYQCGGVARCGDGRSEFEEECDDGNNSNTDACTNSCLNAR